MRPSRHPWLAGAAVAVVLLLGGAYGAAFLLDEPVRRAMERRLNARLEGYTITVGAADLDPFGFALELEDLRLVQDAVPDPPVAEIATIDTSVQWRALLAGALVADMVIVRPVIHLTRAQATTEARDAVPLDERGWQEAVQAMYPLEINELRIVDGDLTYRDSGPSEPVRAEQLALVARNIRNVRAEDDPYPSPITVRARLLGKAELEAAAAADFLATPHPAARLDELRLTDLPIARLEPVLREVGLHTRGGTLSLEGRAEYGIDERVVHLERVGLRDAVIDYHRNGASGVDLVEETAELAAAPEPSPETRLRVDTLRVTGSELGLVETSADPEYRLFVSDLDLTLDALTNADGAEPGRAELRGRFMGSGGTHMVAHFQPAAAEADFDLRLEIEQTDLRTMNDLWRAYGNFDVADGVFAFYSSLRVQDGRVDGYVKPIFTDLDVYDRDQDADENLLQQAYEGIVGGVATLLRNHPGDRVATETDLSGPLENPRTSTWQVVLGLVRNAFFDSILPGLEQRAPG